MISRSEATLSKAASIAGHRPSHRQPVVLALDLGARAGMASGSKEDKWLDVPTGPFARGVGQFVFGADEGDE